MALAKANSKVHSLSIEYTIPIGLDEMGKTLRGQLRG
jgi:hypothetical protein